MQTLHEWSRNLHVLDRDKWWFVAIRFRKDDESELSVPTLVGYNPLPHRIDWINSVPSRRYRQLQKADYLRRFYFLEKYDIYSPEDFSGQSISWNKFHQIEIKFAKDFSLKPVTEERFYRYSRENGYLSPDGQFYQCDENGMHSWLAERLCMQIYDINLFSYEAESYLIDHQWIRVSSSSIHTNGQTVTNLQRIQLNAMMGNLNRQKFITDIWIADAQSQMDNNADIAIVDSDLLITATDE